MRWASVTRQHLHERATFLASLVLVLVVAGAGLSACADTEVTDGQECGTVQQGISSWVIGDASGPESCLWQAYEHCTTATLHYGRMGVDPGTGYSHVITVQPSHGRCLVTDTVYTGDSSGTRYVCNGLYQSDDGNGLFTTCPGERTLPGGGDVWVPRFPALIGTYCGKVELTANGVALSYPATNQNPAACFVHASQTCQAATLVFALPLARYTTLGESHYLYVESQNGGCAVTDVDEQPPNARLPEVTYTVYSCAAVQLQPIGGLAASGCGAEGAVVIPSAPLTPTPTPVMFPKAALARP